MEPPFDPRDLSRNELAAAAIRSFGELRLRVTGSSMLPALQPEDVLHIRHCSCDDAGPGDIILYMRERRLFAHRVVSRSGAQLVTQGDALAQPDLPVTAAEVLGKIVRVLRRERVVGHESRQVWPARIAAFLFRHASGVGRLFIRLQGLPSRARR